MDDLSANELSDYQDQWKSRLGSDVARGYIARRFYEAMNDEDLSTVLRSINESGLFEGELPFDRHGELFSRVMKSSVFYSLLRTVPKIVARLAFSRSE